MINLQILLVGNGITSISYFGLITLMFVLTGNILAGMRNCGSRHPLSENQRLHPHYGCSKHGVPKPSYATNILRKRSNYDFPSMHSLLGVESPNNFSACSALVSRDFTVQWAFPRSSYAAGLLEGGIHVIIRQDV